MTKIRAKGFRCRNTGLGCAYEKCSLYGSHYTEYSKRHQNCTEREVEKR